MKRASMDSKGRRPPVSRKPHRQQAADKIPSVTRESLESLASLEEASQALRWKSPFVLPFWMRLLPCDSEKSLPLLLSVRTGKTLIGIAPLVKTEDTARFLTDPELCDYADLIIASDAGLPFFEALVRHLRKEGIRRLDLASLRPDSVVMTELLPLARERGMPATVEETDAAFELPLPETWEDYLDGLSGHQRHEVRRKLRRLSNSGAFRFFEAADPGEVEAAMERFIGWFRTYHPGKKQFMDENRARFFRELSRALAANGMLRLFILEIEATPAAITFCMEHRETLYLYNNAFDPRFEKLGIGTLGKVLSLKEGIDRGLKVFDFLKGEETYKKRLGGKGSPFSGAESIWTEAKGSCAGRIRLASAGIVPPHPEHKMAHNHTTALDRHITLW